MLKLAKNNNAAKQRSQNWVEYVLELESFVTLTLGLII
jgi:hypothetical protein